jgi:putative component of toxin-antitoxin plasmid stabilization module
LRSQIRKKAAFAAIKHRKERMNRQAASPIVYTRLVRVPRMNRGYLQAIQSALAELRVQAGGDLRTTKLQMTWVWNHDSIASPELSSVYAAVISITSFRAKTTARAVAAAEKLVADTMNS